ncbi:MAG: cytochrome c family protein [Alphaproteobacteria bacterium]|nr:cytochrome c family protein [Alphaproteobacteria bacterium]
MRLKTFAAAALCAAALSFAAPAIAGSVELDITGADGVKMTGDPEAGKTKYNQCATCHSLEAGKNKVGPTLYGIIGRVAGTVEGYNYSKANKESGITWTEQEMFVYLENPKAKIPGTKMAFAGLKKAEDRANVIAYIQESSKAPAAAP